MTISHQQRKSRARRITQIKHGGMPLFSRLEPNAVRSAVDRPSADYTRWVDAAFDAAGAAATARKRDRMAELEAREASDPDERVRGVFNPGDVVEFTPMFIQLTHPIVGTSPALTVRACACELCALGRHVCTAEWLAQYACFRHANRSVIRHHGSTHASELADVPLMVMSKISPLPPRRTRGER